MNIFLILLVLIPIHIPKNLEKMPAVEKKVEKKLKFVPIPPKKREFTEPEKVGLKSPSPWPVLKNRIYFHCNRCDKVISTHYLYPHYPFCRQCDNNIMWEIEKPKDEKKFKKKWVLK